MIIVGAVVAGVVAVNHKPTAISTVSETANVLSAINVNVPLGDTQVVTWNPKDITSDRVAINVIRKVSDNPVSYDLVRVVATSTENDGSATWVPSNLDIGANLYIEIGCTESDSACRASISNSQVSVLDSSQYMNTASAYQSIEAAANK
jgi:hypothetical protein